MNKIYSFGFSLLMGLISYTSSAQCTVTGTETTDGVSVNPMDIGVFCEDAIVSQDVQIVTVASGVVNGSIPFTVNSITIEDVINIPGGLNYSCPDNDCTFFPGTDNFVRGCVLISGTPSAPYDGAIEIQVKINGSALGSNLSIDSSASADIVVKDKNDPSCVIDGLEDFEIGSNLSVFPNPSNGSSQVNLTLPQGAVVRMSVYDVLGNEVASLQNGFLSAGSNAVPLANLNTEEGMYLLKVEIDSSTGTNTYTERLIVK